MGFLAVVNAYNMRVCLSVAITRMGEGKEGSPEWDSATKGLIKSSFYWGYVITHLPGGVLAEKFGGKYSLGIGMLGTAVFTLLTPVITHYGDWQWLVVVRVIEGLGEGTTYPALNALLSKWVPAHERAKIGTFVYAGGQIGTVVGNSLSGVLIGATGSWESVFYVFGAIGLVWFVLWILLCYSDPESHPFVSDKEKQYLHKEIGANAIDRKDITIPWKHILTSGPIWALVAAQIGHDWGFFTMVTDLPTFMDEVLHFNVTENGVISSVPYIAMWIVSMVSAGLCDYLITNNKLTVTFARKMFTTIASVGPAIFLIGASYASESGETVVVTLFCIGMGFMGTFYPGMKVNALDLASNYAGTLMAVVNGIGALSGIATPILVGYITGNHTPEEWQIVFWVSFGVFMVTNIIFVLFGTGEEQWWNNPRNEKPLKPLKSAVFETTKPEKSALSA